MRRAICTGILAVSAVLMVVMGILVSMYFSQIIDSFIQKELELKPKSDIYEKWRKPPVTPIMNVYFFNLTNPREFLQGAKPKLREVGPYTYKETWEKVNLAFHPNNTVSYEPTKKFRFSRELSAGDESDIIFTLNIPLMSAVNQLKWGGKFSRLALSSMLNVLNQETFGAHTVNEMLWGYNDTLFKLAKDIMPPEHVLPHDMFGLLAGKNETSDGTFTVFTGKDDITRYATIDNWNGMSKLPHWKTDECNAIHGTDGTAFPPDLTPNTTLHIYNPDLCRSIPLVFQKTVQRQGIDGYRFGPPTDLFDSVEAKPENDCFCTTGPPCSQQGLFNMSACKFGAPLSVSWPHFLHGDPKLLEDVEGLSPNRDLHEFYIDLQPKLAVALGAKARLQINLQLSTVEDIKQVAGIREMVLPIFWFESGVDSLPEDLLVTLKMVAELPETARAAISSSLFGLGGILLLAVALLIWKRMRSKSYNSGGVSNAQVEFEKRTDGVAVHGQKGSSKTHASPVAMEMHPRTENSST